MSAAGTLPRAAFLAALADRIEAQLDSDVLLVAIDGVDGAGKTRLGDELARELQERKLSVIRSGTDGFHNPRVVRWQRGRASPEGFFRDSFNLALLESALLIPLQEGRPFVTAAFDHHIDASLSVALQVAPIPSVLVFDGLFLHRPELRRYWDVSIFLDVPFGQAYARMAARDGSDPDPAAPGNRRYLEGQMLYFATCDPQAAADILVDYADLEVPRIVRG